MCTSMIASAAVCVAWGTAVLTTFPAPVAPPGPAGAVAPLIVGGPWDGAASVDTAAISAKRGLGDEEASETSSAAASLYFWFSVSRKPLRYPVKTLLELTQ